MTSIRFAVINRCVRILQWFRVLFFRMISQCNQIEGSPIRLQPVLIRGEGTARFGKNVRLGFEQSAHFLSGYSYLELRGTDSKIVICDNVQINNSCTFVALNSTISIGTDTLIGTNVQIFTSDFHNLSPELRLTGSPEFADVTIGTNVFVGSNVTILKGVTIGKNAVIGVGSIVTGDIPANAIAVGIPAKVVGSV